MPWNGRGEFLRTNGVFSGSDLWAQSHGAGRNVRSDDFDTHDEDLASGLENCLARDGQNRPSADLPMAGRRHTHVGDGLLRHHYASVAQLQDGGVGWLGTPEGTNTLQASVLPALPAYAAGQRFAFTVGAANTGAVTLEISARGAKAVKTAGGEALAAGDLGAGDLVLVIYDGAGFRLLSAPSRVVEDARDLKAGVGRANGLATLGGNGKVPAAQLPTPGAATTSRRGTVELATSAEAQAGSDTTRAVTPRALADRTATESRAGLIAQSTIGYTRGEKNYNRATKASHLQYAPSATKAWVRCSGSGAIRDDYNVSSVTDRGTGRYRVNIENDMRNTGYAATASPYQYDATGRTGFWVAGTRNFNAGSVDVTVIGASDSGNASYSDQEVSVAIHGER